MIHPYIYGYFYIFRAYSDGYSRSLSNIGEVAAGGVRAPIVGRVCMDQCMIDVTDAPEVTIGDEATLFGLGGPSAEEVADWIGTITHDVTCKVPRRVPRVYLMNGKVVAVNDYVNPSGVSV
ncbi:MAG: hypothetical protein NWE89_07705 [Candidatus Bathyarchaeota archaeon]|nr:hypothetical protein [Candidatus Bathyarchaeota archaeon]